MLCQKNSVLCCRELLEKHLVYCTCFWKTLNLGQSIDTSLFTILSESSSWYINYVSNPDVTNTKFQKQFQRRFRCQHDSYLFLFNMVRQDDDFFSRWKQKDAVGRAPSLNELVLLGRLRYLGRNWNFDDLEESTSISEEVHRAFFMLSLNGALQHSLMKMLHIPKNPAKNSVNIAGN